MKLFIALFLIINNNSPYILVSKEAYVSKDECVNVAAEMYGQIKADTQTEIIFGDCTDVALISKSVSLTKGM